MPARTSEDLPLPEVPTTATKRLRASRRSSSSLWPSRPKNKCVSVGSKARSPGNGFPSGIARSAIRRLFHLRDERIEHGGREGSFVADEPGLARVEILLLLAGRLRDVNCAGAKRSGAAKTARTRQIAQLGSQPEFVGAAPVDQRGVAQPKVFLVVLSHLVGFTLA